MASFSIERIYERRTRNNRVEYLIKWEGYGEDDNTWETRLNLKDDGYGPQIEAYELYLKNEKKEKRKSRSTSRNRRSSRSRTPNRSSDTEDESSLPRGRAAASRSSPRVSRGRTLTPVDSPQLPRQTSPVTLPLDSPVTTPIKLSPAKKSPATKSPAKKSPAKKSLAKLSPAKLSPAKLSPAKLSPAKLSPAKLSPAKLSPAKKSPAPKSPATKSPAPKSPAKSPQTPASPLRNRSNLRLSASPERMPSEMESESEETMTPLPSVDAMLESWFTWDHVVTTGMYLLLVLSMLINGLMPVLQKKATLSGYPTLDLVLLTLKHATALSPVLCFLLVMRAHVSSYTTAVAIGALWRTTGEVLLQLPEQTPLYTNVAWCSFILADLALCWSLVHLVRCDRLSQFLGAMGFFGVLASDVLWHYDTLVVLASTRVLLMSLSLTFLTVSSLNLATGV